MSVTFGVKTQYGFEQCAAEPFQYPGGEWDLKNITPSTGTFVANVRGADANDLAKAMVFAQLARETHNPFVLLLPYLPAARSDRSMDGRPMGASAYGRWINSMGAEQVITIDPHSTWAKDCYHFCTSLSLAPLVRKALEGHHLYHYVVAPDEGASKRAHEVADNLDLPVIHCTKHRDTSTGKIEGLSVPDDLDPLNVGRLANYLVVDDICDGGRTFAELARQLKLPKEQLGLWVTHGIFSGNSRLLREHYSQIFTTNSHPGHNNLFVKATIIPVEPYLWDAIKEFE